MNTEQRQRLTIEEVENYRLAPSGEGPLADEWKDKPHRLVYDLCGTVQQLLEETQRLKDELQCEFCDEPVYDEQGNALTFLVCGRCWNKLQEQLRQTIDGLRNEVTEAQKAAEKWYHERY